jgi:ribosomal protein S12 methylthiotransferase
MMGLLRSAGMEPASDRDSADVVFINTCAFIADSAQESVDTILEFARDRRDGRIGALVVAGCLAQRYGSSLMEEIPEIDALIGTGDCGRCVEAVQSALRGERPVFIGAPGFLAQEGGPRVIATPKHLAYLKIAEGCANRCSYCLIPSLRGPARSRPVEAIVREARSLASSGVRELVVIAQDTTAYGCDLYGRPSLARLLRELAEAAADGIEWIRVMYTYPSLIDDELIDVFAGEERIVKYLDIPMQHGSDRVLKMMSRRSSRAQMIQVCGRLRERVPGLVLRTSLIVGFPGETDEDFEELLSFIDIVRPERAGVFEFSAEEGTRAYDMPGQVPSEVAAGRRGIAMEALARISREFGESRVGSVTRVLVDGPSDESDLVVEARSYAEAPEVDGKVYIGDATLEAGEMVDVAITDAGQYDLAADRI